MLALLKSPRLVLGQVHSLCLADPRRSFDNDALGTMLLYL